MAPSTSIAITTHAITSAAQRIDRNDAAMDTNSGAARAGAVADGGLAVLALIVHGLGARWGD